MLRDLAWSHSGQFSEGRSTLSMTRICTGPLADSSFSPSSSRRAWSAVGPVGSDAVAGSGVHIQFAYKLWAPVGDQRNEAAMDQLADSLSGIVGLGRPLIDRTGLSGKFDFTLAWAADNGPSPPDSSGAASEPIGP